MGDTTDSLKILLPNGRNIDICTTEGADYFLRYPSSENDRDFSFFSKNLEEANKLRKLAKKRILTSVEKQRLICTYFGADALARYATPSVFMEKMPRKELELWMDHIMHHITDMTTNGNWTRTGVLVQHDAFLLHPCVSMFHHPPVAILAFERGFYQVLADFIAARQAPLLPCADIAETACLIVSNSIASVLFNESVIGWTAEKAFKMLEKCGMLIQFIRCSTVPLDHDPICFSKTYQELMKCTTLVKKKLKKGSTSGNVITNIIDGSDGFQGRYKNTRMMIHIKSIAKLADLFQVPENSQCGSVMKICRHCNKTDSTEEFQRSLMVCSRCKTAYYCSRECQVADWKLHKKACVPAGSKAEQKTYENSQQALLNFAKMNYEDIMERLVNLCEESGISKKETVIEIDFKPNDDGVVPAAAGQFKVGNARRYFEGDRPEEPDWFYKREDKKCYKNNIKNMITGMTDNFNRIADSHVLCLVRHSRGDFGINRLQLTLENGKQMFSNQAYEAFRSAIQDKKENGLMRMFGMRKIEFYRKRYDLEPDYSEMPPEEDLDRVRMMLNALGGDFPLGSGQFNS